MSGRRRGLYNAGMRLVSFGPRGAERSGILLGSTILDLAAADPALDDTWRRLVGRGLLPRAQELASRPESLPERARIPAASVRLGPPIVDPLKIVCLGLNYVDHAAEQAKPVPERPLLFSKAASALGGPRDDVTIPPGITHVDYEAELAVVIGVRGREIKEEDALSHVLGYLILNDVTARKIQKDEGQWFRGKSIDTFAPCGPALVTADEIPDPHLLDISLALNGETRQRSTTANLHFKIPFLISYLSRTMTLDPGDIISTGTPGGVGVYAEPKVFLKEGDEIVTRIGGLGELRNRVRGGG